VQRKNTEFLKELIVFAVVQDLGHLREPSPPSKSS
jgi:hypothetical protein